MVLGLGMRTPPVTNNGWSGAVVLMLCAVRAGGVSTFVGVPAAPQRGTFSQGQNLALTVLDVPSSIGSGLANFFLGQLLSWFCCAALCARAGSPPQCVRVRDPLPNPLLFKGMVSDIASPWH